MNNPPSATATPELLDIQAVASILNVSRAHVRRLFRSGRMPRAIHLGQLVRWRRFELEQWLVAGCPSCGAEAADDT